MLINKWIKKNTAKLNGKRVATSGSTGGLGRELCFLLASLGASLVLVDRNIEKSHALAEEIRQRHTDVDILHIKADMADMDSVRCAADELLKMDIDYLILNAGAYSIPRCICDSGYDNVYQINFISPYYLARRLVSKIRNRGGRIIAVGSIAHNYSKIEESDIDFRGKKQASLVYGNAKRYLTYSLMNMSSDDVIIAHPGISFTGITNHYPPLIFAIIKHPMKVIFMSPKYASLSILYGLFAPVPNGSWIGPVLFDIWGFPNVKRLNTASQAERERIVEIAENIYNNL